MFGDNLKKFRIEKGFSQNELAVKLYVTRQCVSKWEKGITQPDLQTLTKISELLEMSVDELLKDNGNNSNRKPSNTNAGLFIANILAAAFCLTAFIILWRFLPQIVPAHWTHGQIDRYASRNEVFINITTAAVFLSADIIIFFALRKVKDKRVLYISHGIIILFQAANVILITALYAGYLSNVLSFATCLSADLIMCISVAMHPKLNRRNYLLGVRTAETLNSETVWNKTNSLACYLFTGFSLIILVVNMIVIFTFSPLCLLIYIILATVVIVYSKLISRTSY